MQFKSFHWLTQHGITVYVNNSLHLAQKYLRRLVFRHYLFLKAHSLPQATLMENCSLLGTDNIQAQPQSIFLRQIEAVVFSIVNFKYFFATRALLNI